MHAFPDLNNVFASYRYYFLIFYVIILSILKQCSRYSKPLATQSSVI